MKLVIVFLLFVIKLNEVESQKETDDSAICVEREGALKLLYGRDGLPGPPGPKGNRGRKGDTGLNGDMGAIGAPGENGFAGSHGYQGFRGDIGIQGKKGVKGADGVRGDPGDPGAKGEKGMTGPKGWLGRNGEKGYVGEIGQPGFKMERRMETYVLNDFSIAQSGYYKLLYHVKSRDLTDGRTNTGGWGSETPKTGNFIQATYIRPVYVTSVTVAGGFIPSWGHDVRQGYGDMDLEYSFDGNSWLKVKTFPSPVEKKLIAYDLLQPITAKYWRLKSVENKWVGTTEFALKPLIRS